MKIAFSSAVGGGADTHVRTSARWLAEQGHTVHVIYLGSMLPNWIGQHPNIHIHKAPIGQKHYYLGRIGFRHTQYPACLKQHEASVSLSKILGSIKAAQGLDIVELFEGYTHPHLYRDIPFVVKLHGANWTFNSYCEDGSVYAYQVKNDREMLLAATQIHAPSRSVADFISGACNIPRGKIEIVPYALDITEFTPGLAPKHEAPFHLMIVGRLERRKGTHLAIQALCKVWQYEPEVYLHVFGTNGDFGQETIETVVPASEHKGRICFHGFTSRESLIEFYRTVHIHLAPTRYETLGYTILEAFACGRPVIASDIGAVPELVRHQETGWLIPRDDVNALATAILEALQQPERREAYGRAGRLLAERFAVERIMPRQLALYEEAIDTHKGRLG